MLQAGNVVLLAFGVLLVATASPSAAAQGADEALAQARFSYELGALAEGSIAGSCEARAVAFSNQGERSVTVQGASLSLRVYDTWANYTVLAPEADGGIERRINGTQHLRIIPIPSRHVDVAWDAAGQAALFGLGAFYQGEATFGTSFEASAMRAGEARRGHELVRVWQLAPSNATLPVLGDELRTYVGGFPGLARPVDFRQADVASAGNVSLFLRSGTFTAPGFTHEVHPPQIHQALSAPGWALRTEHYQHALLDVLDARVAHPDGSRAYCDTLDAQIQGDASFYRAAGTVDGGGERIHFNERVLTLSGSLRLHEDLKSDDGDDSFAPVAASVDGRFAAVQLDFAPAPGAFGSGIGAGGAALVVVAAAAASWALWKLAAFLFTRLKPDELLALPERRRVYDAIAANPGISLPQLNATEGINPSTARYHLTVLRRHGRIRAFRVQGAWRYVTGHTDVGVVQNAALLEADPALRALLLRVGADPVPAATVVAHLQTELGLSRSGSWKVIDRACAARLLTKQPLSKGVLLRAAS